MKKVQMLEYVSGGRWDGTVWPPAGGALMVPDWEADDLIRGRLARLWPWPEEEAAEPEPVPDPMEPVPVAPPQVSPLAEASAVGVPALAEQDIPGEGAPKPSAPKGDWVAWAVSCGVSDDEANSMSKAELMERYGGRA